MLGNALQPGERRISSALNARDSVLRELFHCALNLTQALNLRWARLISSALNARASVLRELFHCASARLRRVNMKCPAQVTSCKEGRLKCKAGEIG